MNRCLEGAAYLSPTVMGGFAGSTGAAYLTADLSTVATGFAAVAGTIVGSLTTGAAHYGLAVGAQAARRSYRAYHGEDAVEKRAIEREAQAISRYPELHDFLGPTPPATAFDRAQSSRSGLERLTVNFRLAARQLEAGEPSQPRRGLQKERAFLAERLGRYCDRAEALLVNVRSDPRVLQAVENPESQLSAMDPLVRALEPEAPEHAAALEAEYTTRGTSARKLLQCAERQELLERLSSVVEQQPRPLTEGFGRSQQLIATSKEHVRELINHQGFDLASRHVPEPQHSTLEIVVVPRDRATNSVRGGLFGGSAGRKLTHLAG